MARSNRELGSRPVVRIATSGVALGVALMMLASAIVHGFQHEVKTLVVGFDSHVKVTPSDPGANGLVWDQATLDTLRAAPGVAHVALRHERAGIVETPNALQGVIVRGVDATSRVDRIEAGLLRGRLPHASSEPAVCIGAPLAQKLELDTGDRVTLYLVVGTDDIRPRPSVVCGIYETGLQEFDLRHVWAPATVLQEAAARGAEAQIFLDSSATAVRAVGQAFGRDSRGARWRGSWSGFPGEGLVSGRRSLVLDDLPRDATPKWIVGDGPLADTATLAFSHGAWRAEPSKGSHHRVVESYDVWVSDLRLSENVQEELFRRIPYDWQAARVDQQHPEMFSWLNMLDLNVQVIVGLMVLISIINMTSALLIILLERRQQIGLLKALGMSDSGVIRTFVWHAARILGTGFAWGNLVGMTLLAAQSTWNLVPLNPEAYYVDAVPIRVDVRELATLEATAFVVCVAAMVLPALWSTRIRPALTMRMT